MDEQQKGEKGGDGAELCIAFIQTIAKAYIANFVFITSQFIIFFPNRGDCDTLKKCQYPNKEQEVKTAYPNNGRH